MKILLKTAIAARTKKNYALALRILDELSRDNANDPNVSYHRAWTLDNMGKEKGAIHYYRLAIANGLNGPALRDCYIGLGSSLRCARQFSDSISVLRKAAKRYPKYPAIEIFLGLTYLDAKQYRRGARRLLKVLLETASDDGIKSYRRVLSDF